MDPTQSVLQELFSLANHLRHSGGRWFLAGWIAVGAIWALFLFLFGRRGSPSPFR